MLYDISCNLIDHITFYNVNTMENQSKPKKTVNIWKATLIYFGIYNQIWSSFDCKNDILLVNFFSKFPCESLVLSIFEDFSDKTIGNLDLIHVFLLSCYNEFLLIIKPIKITKLYQSYFSFLFPFYTEWNGYFISCLFQSVVIL